METPFPLPQKIQVDLGGNKADAPPQDQPKPKPAALLYAELILHHTALVQPLLLLPGRSCGCCRAWVTLTPGVCCHHNTTHAAPHTH